MTNENKIQSSWRWRKRINNLNKQIKQNKKVDWKNANERGNPDRDKQKWRVFHFDTDDTHWTFTRAMDWCLINSVNSWNAIHGDFGNWLSVFIFDWEFSYNKKRIINQSFVGMKVDFKCKPINVLRGFWVNICRNFH